MRGATAFLAGLGLAAALAAGCSTRVADDRSAAALEQRLAATRPANVNERTWLDVRRFYDLNSRRLAWVSARDPLTGAAALDVLRRAWQHGLNPQAYGIEALDAAVRSLATAEAKAPDRFERLVDLDARITASLLSFGHDVAVGTSRPSALDPRWQTRRTAPDVAAALAESSGNLSRWVTSIQPQHPEYVALLHAMGSLVAQQARGGWPTIGAAAAKNAAFAADESVAGRLADEGFATVKAFQEHHRLAPTGKLDAATIDAMNVPIEWRIKQVAINLERWRWMPDDFGDRHLLVNIPAFTVYAREHGKVVQDIRVVVGKADGHQTPIFSGTMTNVVLSPYWNVPDSIAQGETAPAAAIDPGYLSRNNIEVIRNGRVIDEGEIDWNDPAELRRISFRQAPGAKNALGRVKFLFPNQYDVYLHDTPSDSLFKRPMRALSHGCVRVEEPETLANYVLRGDAKWTEEKIATAMLSGVEQGVKLQAAIPVHIVYFTTWVDEAGGLHFLSDPYGYDRRQAGVAAPSTPARAVARKNLRAAN